MTWVDLGLPEDYIELPLDVEPDDPELEVLLLAALRARLAQDEARLSGPPEALVPLLRAFHHEAWDHGAMAAGVQVLDLPDTRYVASVRTWLEDEDELGPIDLGVNPRSRADRLAAVLAEPRPGDLTSRQVRVVDLPAGPAVQVAYQADEVGGQADPSEPAMVLEVLEHWFVLADQARPFVVQGRTAHLAHRDGLAADLDRIAASVRFTP